MQGAQILRSEAYLMVRRNDEGCSATLQMDFLRSHQVLNFSFPIAPKTSRRANSFKSFSLYHNFKKNTKSLVIFPVIHKFRSWKE